MKKLKKAPTDAEIIKSLKAELKLTNECYKQAQQFEIYLKEQISELYQLYEDEKALNTELNSKLYAANEIAQSFEQDLANLRIEFGKLKNENTSLQDKLILQAKSAQVKQARDDKWKEMNHKNDTLHLARLTVTIYADQPFHVKCMSSPYNRMVKAYNEAKMIIDTVNTGVVEEAK